MSQRSPLFATVVRAPGARIVAFGLCLALLTAGCDRSEQPEARTVEGRQDSVVIDLDAIAKALGRDQQFKSQIESAKQRLSNQVSELATGLKKQLDNEQTKLGTTPDAEGTEALRKLTVQAQLQLRRGQQVAQQQAQQFQIQLIAKFRQEVAPIAERIARARGARLVLVKSNLLWYDPSTDISEAVIDAMRASAASGSQG